MEQFAQWVVSAQGGDQPSLNLLLQRLTAPATAQARRRVAACYVDEIVQDALVQVYLNLRRIDHPRAVLSYLRTTVYRLCAGHYRAKSRFVPWEDEEPEAGRCTTWGRLPDTAEDPCADAAIDHLRAEAANRAFEQLPERSRRLVDCHVHQMPYAERCRTLQIPHGSVGPMTKRAVAALRDSPELTPWAEAS